MYAIAGVTGNTGKVVAETLLAQGKKVRVLVRDAAKGAPFAAKGAEVAVAELGDAAAVARALDGAEGAYLLVPPDYGSTSMLAAQAKVVGALADAVAASRVPHVVLLSSVGAQHPAGTGPIRTLHLAEERLGKAAEGFTAVRASYFMENWGANLYALAQGALPTFLARGKAIPMVATRDIGLAAASALLEGPRGRSVIELAGPKDYAPDDIARALTAITGKTVTAQEGPEDAIVPALTAAGMTADVAELFREMLHGVNTGHVAPDASSARRVRGVTPIEDVLRALLAKA